MTPQANVGGQTLNPVFTSYNDFGCNGWFEAQGGGEGALHCSAVGASSINSTDLALATGDITLLPEGLAWASETGLYAKLVEHPESLSAYPALQNLLSRAN